MIIINKNNDTGAQNAIQFMKKNRVYEPYKPVQQNPIQHQQQNQGI